MVNSCKKGKRRERQAAAWLVSLGFEGACRGQQHRGGPDSPDVTCMALPNVRLEVKGRGDMPTPRVIETWLAQAERECGPKNRAAVLVMPDRKPHVLALSYEDAPGKVMMLLAPCRDLARLTLVGLQQRADLSKGLSKASSAESGPAPMPHT